MTHKPDTHRSTTEQQKRKAATEAVEQKEDRSQPHELAERALMQRQGKQLHKQTGK